MKVCDYVCAIGKKVDIDKAKRLAVAFEAEFLEEMPREKNASFFVLDKTGLSFINNGKELRGDFTKLLDRVTNGHLQHELLNRLVASENGERIRIVDATAGLGEDSFIMAATGAEITMFEHNPITYEVLNDALIRTKNNATVRDIAKRMTLKKGDSKDLLTALDFTPDIIYLDPMYAEKKKSSESKKKLQALHLIESPCADETKLFETALSINPKKIIVKRPPDGEYLDGRKPTFSIDRKAVRFDVYSFSQS